MVQLVETLLSVSRIDLGTLLLRPQAINLKEMLGTVLEELDVGIQARHLLVVSKLQRGLRPVMIDREALRIVLQNLLSNAIQYSPPGKQILVQVRQDKRQTMIIVQDHGIGIPRNEQHKLFSKLFRAANAKNVEPGGSGLGLYIVKAMIEQSGGRVWFESTERRGSTFYATIPFER
jgi:two-component system sensor histidine kinase VicK